MFLDRCDICHKPKVCRGYKDKILCDDCIKSLKGTNEEKKENVENKENKKIVHIQKTTIFDFI